MFKKILVQLSPLFAFRLIKTTFIEFFKEKSFFHGAALAYYAIFALVPVLYLAINYLGMFLGNDTMIEIISEVLLNYVGIKDISGILSFLKGVDFEKSNFWLNTVGIVVLLFSSTVLLNSLRESINEFYDVEPEYKSRKKQLLMTLVTKLISIVLMTGIGLIVIVFYFAETIALSISEGWLKNYEFLNYIASTFLHHAIAVVSNIIIFGFMFKYLNDGIVKWKIAIVGSIFTSLLLYLGQILIKYYIANFFFGASGGVAGTLLVILVWMYYTSQIIFLGAKFTKVYGDFIDQPIRNKKY